MYMRAYEYVHTRDNKYIATCMNMSCRTAHHIREGKFPLWLKYIDVAIIACMWKWYYYAPNTLKEQ